MLMPFEKFQPAPLVAAGDIKATDAAVFITRLWQRAILYHGEQKKLTVGMLELLLYASYGCSFIFNGSMLFHEDFYVEDRTAKVPIVSSVFGYDSRAIARDLDTQTATAICVGPKDGLTGEQIQVIGSATYGLCYYDEDHLRELLLYNGNAYKNALRRVDQRISPLDIKMDFMKMWNDISHISFEDFITKKTRQKDQYGFLVG